MPLDQGGAQEIGTSVSLDWKLCFLGTFLPPSQPACPSCWKLARKRAANPPGTSSDPANSTFFIPVAGPGLHPPHGSAQSQPEPEYPCFSPEAFFLAQRHCLRGCLHDPIDLYRLLLAAVPCWLYFKARVARPLQVSEAAGMLAKGLWQEGALRQLLSSGKQHMWTALYQGGLWRPRGDELEFKVKGVICGDD